MGCDIHAYVEIKSKANTSDDSWNFLSSYSFTRNYTLFALMAEVRRHAMYPDPKTLEEALLKRGVSRLDDPKLSIAESELIMREGCDSGITRGKPSFEEKGIPKDISWRIADEYTFYVVENEDDVDDRSCTRSQADSWLASSSSEVWEHYINGNILRVTNPDWHTGSWLDIDEVKTLTKRFREILVASIPDVKIEMAQSIEWAERGLETTIKEENAERIANFKEELKRAQNWDAHDPLKEAAYVRVEALVAMMNALDTHGFNARVVFWFDN